MSGYNLLDEKWIPIRYPDGSRDELGIAEVLLRSRDIAVIEDPSPLVVAGLHRLLLAVLYRALMGPTDIEEAGALFRDGLPTKQIRGYLDEWRERFWLFDEQYPFYQVPDYEPRSHKGEVQWKSWAVLAMEHNGDNSKVLVDHLKTTDSGTIPTGQAARWLMACQAFTPGGGNSDFAYTKGAPIASAAVVLPLGRNLQDTLIFQLVPENRDVLESDLPIWERSPETAAVLHDGPERSPTGWVDLYTWRSRSVRLRSDSTVSTVSALAFASGLGLLSGELLDPMVAYRIHKEHGRLPVQLLDRGLWRDFDSMMPDESQLAPRVIENAAMLSRSFYERAPISIVVMGQATSKAKIEFWRMEKFVWPEALTGDRILRMEIRRLLEEAEKAERQLGAASLAFARCLISRGERDPADKDKKAFVQQMSGGPFYWSVLESRFHEMLEEMRLVHDSEDVRRDWLKAVRGALSEAWKRHRLAVSTGDAWTIRALVKAEGPVMRKLRELDEEIAMLTPEPEIV